MNVFKLASRNVLRNRRRTVVTTAAMTLALLVMILYSGLVTGYLMSAERNLLDLELGDIQIHAPTYRDRPSIYTRIMDGDALVEKLRASGLSASARLKAAGLAAIGDSSSGAVFIGVDPEGDKSISRLFTALQEGAWLDDAKLSGVVIGAQMAKNLSAKIGDELVVLSQATDGSMANELYTVRGILKNVSSAVDRSGVFMTEKAYRALMVLPDGVHQIIVRRPTDMPLEVARERAVEAAKGEEIKTWRELSPTLASMMDSMQGTMYTMFFIIYIAIGIVILNAMLMAVFERIREFGVLKAVGGGPLQVLSLIFIEGMMQTVTAMILGCILSIPGLYYLSHVGLDMSSMGNITIQGIVWDPIWRAHVSVETFVGPTAVLFTVVGLALLYPAIKAASLRPIEAIHHQ